MNMTTCMRGAAGLCARPVRIINTLAACALVAGAALVVPNDNARGCGGTPPPPPAFCAKSYSFAKAGPLTVIAGGATTVPVTTYHFITYFGTICPPGPITVTMSATLTCAPPPSSGPTVLGPFAVGTGATTLTVAVPVPAGPPRICLLAITSTVTFPDGTSISQTADQTICIVDPAPADPTKPRLDMELLTPAVVTMHAGDQETARYRITNNDLVESWTGTIDADFRNTSDLADGGVPGVYAIADPGPGDNWPIVFESDLVPGDCVVLPPDPQNQTLSAIQQVVTIPPNSFVDVGVVARPWGMCADGSCGESTVVANGQFSDTSNGFACAGTAYAIDNALPPQFAWPDSGQTSFVQPSFFNPQALELQGQPRPKVQGVVDAFTPESSYQLRVNGVPQSVFPFLLPRPLGDPFTGRLETQMDLPGPFAVDSFFDVEYRIEFAGSPAGPPLTVQLQGLALIPNAPFGFENVAPLAMGRLQIAQPLPSPLPQWEEELTWQFSADAQLADGSSLPMDLFVDILPDPAGANVHISASAVPGAARGIGPAPITSIVLRQDVRAYAAPSFGPAPCDGDANGDGVVDVADVGFVIFRLGSVGAPCIEGDVDGNGTVDIGDISYVIFRLGTCNPGGPC